MERRKILLGSGAVFATVLAGCSSSETDEPRDGSDDSNDSFGDSNGDDEKDEKDGKEGEKDDKDDKDDKDHKDEKDDHVPGLKKGKLELDSDLLSIKDVTRDGKDLTVVVHTETLDEEKLSAELESLVDSHEDAVVDPEKFAAEIDTVYWHIEKDKNKIASFYVEVDWIVKHLRGKLSKEQLLEKINETVE